MRKTLPLLAFMALTGASQAQGLQNGMMTPLNLGASRIQLGLGVNMARNENFGEEAGFGMSAELGWLYDHNPIDMVWGIRGAYIADVGDNDSDTDILDVSLFGRVLFPLGADAIKLYGEGRVGLGNLSVAGGSKFSDVDVDSAAWTFGWGLGFGVQLDFTRTVGLRVGYELHSYGDLETLGFKKAPGFVHGGSASLVFKF
jgi:opacity protein-like surface antigen